MALAVDLDAQHEASAAAGAVLAELAATALASLAPAAAGDVEELHDLRVAVRRARSVLRELRSALPDTLSERVAHVRSELRWVQVATGAARDLDVQLDEWSSLASAVGPRHAAGLAPIAAALRDEHAEARDAVARTLHGPRVAQAIDAWRDLADALAGAPAGAPAESPAEPPGASPAGAPRAHIGEVASRRAWQLYRRVVRKGPKAVTKGRPEQVHDLRKRGKELRYVLELFGPAVFADTPVASAANSPAAGAAGEAGTSPHLPVLKRLQDALGHWHDLEVQQARIAAVSRDSTKGGTKRVRAAARAARRHLAAEQRAALAVCAERLDDLAAADLRRALKQARRRARQQAKQHTVTKEKRGVAVEKLSYLLWRDGRDEPARVADAVLGATEAMLVTDGLRSLTVYTEAPEASAMRWGTDPRGGVLTASVVCWIDRLELRGPLEDALAAAGSAPGIIGLSAAGYVVVESAPIEYGDARTWADGERSPGVSIVTAFDRLPGIGADDFYGIWHGSHTPLTFEIHPMWQYLRNAVLRGLAPGAPRFSAIVHESVPTLEDLLDPLRFFGAGESTQQLKANIRRVNEDLARFADARTLQTTPMHEVIVRSAPWAAPAS